MNEVEQDAPVATEHAATAPVPPGDGAAEAVPSALLGVVPSGADVPEGWDAADASLRVRLVTYRDLSALLSVPPPAGRETDPEEVAARHWEVHRALLRGTIAPAPAGVLFASDAEVVRFLTESYALLKGALAMVEGRWEFRLHVMVVDNALAETFALDLVTHVYAELRRLSASAVPFPKSGRRILSAAFLVDRASSSAFRSKVEDLAHLNAALEMDLTGPWPPYDFVSMHG